MARGRLLTCETCPYFADGFCKLSKSAVDANAKACETWRKIHHRQYVNEYYKRHFAKKRATYKQTQRTNQAKLLRKATEEAEKKTATNRAEFLKRQAERDKLFAEFTHETVRKLANGRTIIMRK